MKYLSAYFVCRTIRSVFCNRQLLPCWILNSSLTIGIVSLAVLFIPTIATGEGRDLTELSLEELMSLEIKSVSKKKQKVSDSPAAIYVITQEDIRRSGVTSIPEALRMAPGLQVAKLNNSQWAVSARGFNDRFSTKLLVLIDGRTVYNPLFQSVNWEDQDTVLEDILRIEVIRGPGGSLWGVNGVINIITKHSKDTVGTLISGIAGSEAGIFSIRHGGYNDKNFHYRLFAK